jgi:hypothetical protein
MTPLPLVPEDCHLFNSCNAAICPLDPRWPSAYHRREDKVCHYLLATAKAGADEHYRDDLVYQEVQKRAPEILKRWKDIDRRVEKAAQSGLKTRTGGVSRPKKSPNAA